MLKIKNGFLLRRLGKEYMAVAIGEASESFNGMIRLNETGAFYWKELEQGTTEAKLVEKTLERFENLNEESVKQDVKEFLDAISLAVENDAENN